MLRTIMFGTNTERHLPLVANHMIAGQSESKSNPRQQADRIREEDIGPIYHSAHSAKRLNTYASSFKTIWFALCTTEKSDLSFVVPSVLSPFFVDGNRGHKVSTPDHKPMNQRSRRQTCSHQTTSLRIPYASADAVGVREFRAAHAPHCRAHGPFARAACDG